MDFIIIGIVICILGFSVGYTIKQKKKGVRCIGCSSCTCNCKHKQQ